MKLDVCGASWVSGSLSGLSVCLVSERVLAGSFLYKILKDQDETMKALL